MSAARLVTLVIVLVAALLRFVFIDWGAPFTYHPDEHFLVHPAAAIAHSGDLNPHWFGYPSLWIYVEAMLARLVATLSATPLDVAVGVDGLSPWDVHPAQWKLVWIGRCSVALMGTLCVWLSMRTAAICAGTTAAWCAGMLAAVSPLLVENAHYLTTDVPASTLMTLTLLLVARDQRIVAGLVGGLAASTKYTAGIVLLLPLGAALLRRERWRDLPLVLIAAAAGFVMATPYAVLDFATFQRDMEAQRQHYMNAITTDSTAFYLSALVHRAASVPICLLALPAVLGLARRPKAAAIPLLVLAMSIAYLLVLSAYPQRYERNLVLLIPLLAVALATGLTWAGQWLVPRYAAWVPLVVLLAALPALRQSIDWVYSLRLPDTRTLAYRWINERVPQGAVIAREEYTPVLTSGKYDLRFLWSLGFRDYGWYLGEKVDYLVMSGDVYQRLMTPPYPAGAGAAQFYTTIFEQLPLVSEMTPNAQQRGPVIRVYQIRRD